MTTVDPQSAADPARVDPHVDHMVNRIAESIRGDERIGRLPCADLPHPETVIEVVEDGLCLLFPGFFGPREVPEGDLDRHVDGLLRDLARKLFGEVHVALRYGGDDASDDRSEHGRGIRAEQIVASLLAKLPEIRATISLDVQAALDGDPAARHTDEIILCYPGVRALSIHRIAHELYRLGVPLIPRIMAEYAHAKTCIDIHPGARIGRSFFIDHGTGVVIGETTVIGDHCKIYQGVTLGAKSFPKDERGRLRRGVKRHPTLEDHVTVYAGATILGGTTVIGAGSVINGGVFLTSSVPPGHVVRGPKTDITLRSNPQMPPGMYNI